jgi:hypothetical protein
LQVCTSRIHNFLVLPQEQNYITWALHWIGASELFSTLNGSWSHATCCSRWRKQAASITVFMSKKNKTLFGGGGQSVVAGGHGT